MLSRAKYLHVNRIVGTVVVTIGLVLSPLYTLDESKSLENWGMSSLCSKVKIRYKNLAASRITGSKSSRDVIAGLDH